MPRPTRVIGIEPRAVACRALAAAVLVVAGIACAQSLKIPDFRQSPPPRDATHGPKPGETCERCGEIRSIREIQEARPVGVPGAFQTQPLDRGGPSPNLVGAVVMLPMGESSDKSFVGGVGTPEMRERFSETSYEITIRLDGGGFNFVRRRDGASFRVGDRVRVEGTQLTLLAQ